MKTKQIEILQGCDVPRKHVKDVDKENTAKEIRFEIGDVLPEDAFSKKMLKDLLAVGAMAPIDEEEDK